MHFFIIGLLDPAICLAHHLNSDARLDVDFYLMPRTHSARGLPASGKEGVMHMNRIAPSTMQLYIANADGTNERLLLG